jgi:hypothetical protein
MRDMIIGMVSRSDREDIVDYVQNHYGFKIMMFRDRAKNALQEMFNLNDDEFIGQGRHEEVDYIGKCAHQMLKDLYEDFGRKLCGEDIWVTMLGCDLANDYSGDNIFIPDVRFENERQLIKSLGGYVIHSRMHPYHPSQEYDCEIEINDVKCNDDVVVESCFAINALDDIIMKVGRNDIY